MSFCSLNKTVNNLANYLELNEMPSVQEANILYFKKQKEVYGVDYSINGYTQLNFNGEDAAFETFIKLFDFTGEKGLKERTLANRYSTDVIPIVCERLGKALNAIYKLRPELYAAYRLLVNQLYCFKYYGANSASNLRAPGIIFLAPVEDYPAYEYYAELLVHEILHQVLNLEEYTHGLFIDEGIISFTDSYGFVGAISSKEIPFRVVVHSFFIAMQCTQFYLVLKEWSPYAVQRINDLTQNFERSFAIYKQQLKQYPAETLFSENGLKLHQQLLVDAEAFIKDMQTGEIAPFLIK